MSKTKTAKQNHKKSWSIERINKDIQWRQDRSGLYTLIRYILPGLIRIDIMGMDQNPVKSFMGSAENLRKAAARYLSTKPGISFEHISYIGNEIAKANLQGKSYIQD